MIHPASGAAEHRPTVVVGTDVSSDSEPVVEYALREAAMRAAGLLVVTVVDLPAHPNARYGIPDLVLPVDRIRDSALAAAREQVDRIAVGMEADAGSPASVEVLAVIGAPARELIRRSQDADLLVVGRHGKGGPLEFLLGSTALRCVLHATCPVTVVTARTA